MASTVASNKLYYSFRNNIRIQWRIRLNTVLFTLSTTSRNACVGNLRRLQRSSINIAVLIVVCGESSQIYCD